MKKLSSKDKTIHDQFSKYGKNAKEWINKCVLLLPKIDENRIWEKKGFSNIYEYAAKIAGMSRNKVNEGLRILKKTENLPAIRKIVEIKGIFAVKPVVNIATKETDIFWAKKADEMKKNTLETFVRDFRKEQEEKSQNCFNDRQAMNNNLQTVDRPGAGSPINNGLNKNQNLNIKIQISMKLSPEIVNALKKIKGEGDWEQAIKKLLKYSREGLEAEKKEFEIKEKYIQEELKELKPEPVKTNNHTVPTVIQDYIKKRSKGKCEHPNCNKQGKHIHHIEPFALNKKHDPDKLVYLCEEHHQIIHLGYIDDGQIALKKEIFYIQELSTEQINNSWKQIEKLPDYDIKNLINKRISKFRQNEGLQRSQMHNILLNSKI